MPPTYFSLSRTREEREHPCTDKERAPTHREPRRLLTYASNEHVWVCATNGGDEGEAKWKKKSMRGKERTELLLLFWMLYIYLRDQRYPFYYYVLFRVFSAVMCGVCNIVSSCDVRNEWCRIRYIAPSEPLKLLSAASRLACYAALYHSHTHRRAYMHGGKHISLIFPALLLAIIFRLRLGCGERRRDLARYKYFRFSFHRRNRIIKMVCWRERWFEIFRVWMYARASMWICVRVVRDKWYALLVRHLAISEYQWRRQEENDKKNTQKKDSVCGAHEEETDFGERRGTTIAVEAAAAQQQQTHRCYKTSDKIIIIIKMDKWPHQIY